MKPETGSEHVECVLVDVDAQGKIQLYNAEVLPDYIKDVESAAAHVKADGLRVIIAPQDVAALFAAVGWQREQITVGAKLFQAQAPAVPTLGSDDDDTYGSQGDDD